MALVRGPGLGGTELHIYDLLLGRYDIRAFGLAQHQLDVTGSQVPCEYLSWRDAVGGRSLSNAYRSRFKSERYYMPGLEKRLAGYQIVHTGEIHTTFSAQTARAKKRLGYKLVVFATENIPFPCWNEPGGPERKREVLEAADFYLALTEDARRVLQLDGVSDSKIRVVPYGVDLERFKAGPPDRELQHRLHLEPGRFTILFVGRLVWEKGIYDLLNAVRVLNRKDVQLLFVGEGPERGNLERYTEMIGLTSSVRFSPYLNFEEVHRAYSLASVFVLPSLPTLGVREQFGIVLIEAMACGIPTIVTRCGSMPGVIQDAGLLANSGDAVSLSECLGRLADSPALCRQLGARGVELARSVYDRKKVAEGIADVYRQLL